GSAHEVEDGKTTKYIAYTVCLDSSGDFQYIRPLSSSSSEEEYLSLLKANLEAVLKAELQKVYTTFVLHLPYKIKRPEIEAIKSVVAGIRGNNDCDVIVIRINTEHRFLGFSPHNTRVP